VSSVVPISVSIVEDSYKMRESLATLLRRASGISFLKSYPNAEMAVADIPGEPPDVALVDINLPGMSGIECVARLKVQLPQMQFLMLTTYEETELIFNSLRAGARGYVLKKAIPTELLPAIEQVHGGGAPMSMQIARKVVDHFNGIGQTASEVEKLTQREQEVLTLLAKGFLYKEISDKLGISMSTVRTYLQRAYEKLHVTSRTEAAAKFRTTYPEQN
jgi:DNA-binding NarL/FixJ family response regulator